jgi:hypothetical protein
MAKAGGIVSSEKANRESGGAVLETRDMPNYTNIEKHLVFEFSVKRKNKSGFIREDTRNSANPISIDSPRTFILMPTSKHYLGTGHGYAITQYIPNANTIFVDDYIDEKGVSKKGLKSQGYDLEFHRKATPPISFSGGTGLLDLRKYDSDPALVAFINAHELNDESPAGKQKQRLLVTTHKFKPLRKEEKAQKKALSFDVQEAVVDILRAVRTRNADGTYTYNEELLNSYLRILGIIPENKYGANENAQKFVELHGLSTTSPEQFIQVISQGLKDVEMVLAKAFSAEIIKISSIGIDLAIGEAKNIYTFKEKVETENLLPAAAIAMISTASMYNNYIIVKNEVDARS